MKSKSFLTIALVTALLISYLPLNLTPAQQADTRDSGFSHSEAAQVAPASGPLQVKPEISVESVITAVTVITRWFGNA